MKFISLQLNYKVATIFLPKGAHVKVVYRDQVDPVVFYTFFKRVQRPFTCFVRNSGHFVLAITVQKKEKMAKITG